jgi:3-hydroxy-3-methylglutaryl CoA synthase
MTGIVSYSAWISLRQLSRQAITEAWRSVSTGGERSVARNDEDTITMANEAAISCLATLEGER